MNTVRAKRNKTLSLDQDERAELHRQFGSLESLRQGAKDTLINADALCLLDALPESCVDLLLTDPPYNLRRTFASHTFLPQDEQDYRLWLERWIAKLPRVLKPEASLYICCDWRCSSAVEAVLKKYFTIQNRITWEREKGRAALRNWKGASEDIWFATVSSRFTFNAAAVKLVRKVVAPYTNGEGRPKDWTQSEQGRFRTTAASNLWTDLTVPFWSMAENTPHPTQKPEKLAAKIICASSREGDLVLDPFLGSGTSAVVAKKLGRHFIGGEIEEEFCLLAQKRINAAAAGQPIQGLFEGKFWERNSVPFRLP